MEITESKGLQVQEPMRFANGEEEIFRIAISKPSIRNSHLDELEGVLRLVMLKIGLRAENLPSREEKGVIIDHMFSTYGNHTIEEIKLAFDMALTYKLDLSEKEIICYENFSCLYISRILNAYRKWAIDAYNFISKTKETPLLEEKKELTTEEWDEWIEEMKSYDLKLLPCTAYDYLTKIGKINISVEKKHEYMDRSIAHLLAQFEVGSKEMLEYLKMKKDGIFNAQTTSSLITIAKRFALQDYLRTI